MFDSWKIISGEKKTDCEALPLGVSPSSESSVVTGAVPPSDDDEIKETLEDFAADGVEMGSTLVWDDGEVREWSGLFGDEDLGFPNLWSVNTSCTTWLER